MGKGRAPCCDKSQVKRGPWSPAEDLRLSAFIQKYGHKNWRALPKQAGLLRCGKSCRLRWINYLRPDLKRGNFTKEEEDTITSLHQALGNKWSKIASHFPGRTDNEIKHVWNTHLKKRLAFKAVDSNLDESKAFSTSASSSSFSSVSFMTVTSFCKRRMELEVEHEQHQATVTRRPRSLENMQDLKEHKVGPSSSTSSDNSNDTNSSHHVSLPENHANAHLDRGAVVEEVNKPDVPQEMCDCDFEFWNMVYSASSFGTIEGQLNGLKASQSSNPGDAPDCEEDENKNWLRDLEIELGL
uniref:Uncharacterized protein n=1 Tax=Rhizophora mucronata TaxID=61149 RepID=A0A2P2M5B3_RHIMU